MHGSQRRDRRGSTSNMTRKSFAELSRDAEEVLYSRPAAAEAVVFGVSLESWIEAVAAAVLFREGEGATTDELIAFVRESLASFKCPKYIVEMDPLPKNPSSQILKRELRDQYSDLPADLDEAKG
jgi:fatty-acyl-CoA synthase